MKKRLLLLSNSSLPEQAYLEFALDPISKFLDMQGSNVVFIPFAGVTFSYNDYTEKVKKALNSLNLKITGIHEVENKKQLIEDSDIIMVGGGNTFRLLERCYHFDLIQSIRKAVNDGTSYIGWSAGSNLAGPTICTTNDMPIIQPSSFEALNLISHQINPHFNNDLPPGHKGETREQRLEEYLALNKDSRVIAIPEGTYLEFVNEELSYSGQKEGFIFSYPFERINLRNSDKIL